MHNLQHGASFVGAHWKVFKHGDGCGVPQRIARARQVTSRNIGLCRNRSTACVVTVGKHSDLDAGSIVAAGNLIDVMLVKALSGDRTDIVDRVKDGGNGSDAERLGDASRRFGRYIALDDAGLIIGRFRGDLNFRICLHRRAHLGERTKSVQTDVNFDSASLIPKHPVTGSEVDAWTQHQAARVDPSG
jgi:hypothetical protein